jgi:hypothetical protein
VQTETVVRVRGTDLLDISTLCPAEPWVVGQPGQDAHGGIINGWRLYLPEGSDITPPDNVRVRGVEYAVLGTPAAWSGGGLVVEAGDLWTAQCTIRHPGGVRGAFNSSTGTYAVTPYPAHYSGECRVEVLQIADRNVEAAGEILTSIGYLIVVDLAASTEVRVDDLVTLGAPFMNGDPALVDRTFQVQSFSRGAMPWQRNLICSDFLAPESVS